MAWEFKLSEEEFLERFSTWERDQLMATYRNKAKRAFVAAEFPPKMPKGKR